MYQINEGKLANFIENTKKLISTKPQMNESNTRLKVIVPLLELLGWDINSDVETEYPVRVGSTIAKVDYALSIEGKPTILLEAKGFDSDINDNFARQTISYGRYEDVKWAVLTNGKSLHIYDTTLGKNPKECLIDKIDIEEFINKKSTLCLLSKESIKNKETDSIVERIRKTQDYINNLYENKEEFTKKISSVLKKPADKSLYKKIDEISQEIFDSIVKELKISPKEITVIEKSKKIQVIKKPRFEGQSIIPEMKRMNIRGNDDDLVAVFPSRVEGVEFLKKYNAWGFVKMNQPAKFLALYVGSPFSKVMYFGEIDYCSNRYEDKEEIKNVDDTDKTTFKPGKQIVYLKRGSLFKLSDPIPVGKRGSAPYSLQYTMLKRIKSAKTTEDMRQEKMI